MDHALAALPGPAWRALMRGFVARDMRTMCAVIAVQGHAFVIPRLVSRPADAEPGVRRYTRGSGCRVAPQFKAIANGYARRRCARLALVAEAT